MNEQEILHLRLNALNRLRLQPDVPSDDWTQGGCRRWEEEARRAAANAAAEISFLEDERAMASAQALDAPQDRAGFLEWFTELRRSGPGQHHPLFDFLEHEATYDQMQWFVRQEVAGEAGFDDLVALTQLRMPVQAKLEMARNYWDEMGRGKQRAMHGPLLGDLASSRSPSPTSQPGSPSIGATPSTAWVPSV